MQVIVPEAESRAGLALKPKTFPVTVADRPVMDVTFSQFLASVLGKISCLGKTCLESKSVGGDFIAAYVVSVISLHLSRTCALL